MRLAILAGLGSPWSYAAIEAIARQGVEVEVIHIPPDGAESYINPQSPGWQQKIASLESKVSTRVVAPISGGKLRYFKLGPWLKRRWRANPPDVVLSLYGGGMALSAVLSGHPKVAIYAVGSDVLSVKFPYKLLTAWSLQRTKLVLANGEFLAEETKCLAPNARVESLLLGVDTDRFVPGHSSGAVQLICSRGFKPVYNNLAILKALALLPEGLPEWKMVFAAGGELREPCQRWAEANLSAKQRQRVSFLGGVGPDELLSVVQQSDVFVSMSRSDGTATSLLEALSCGLFPVLSDIPANRKWAEPGFLIAQDDVVGLARALANAIEGEAMRKAAKPRLRQKIVDTANSETNMVVLVQRLKEL